MSLFFSQLDVLLYMSSFLSLDDLFALSSASRMLHRVADEDKVWKPRLQAALAIARTTARFPDGDGDSAGGPTPPAEDAEEENTDVPLGGAGAFNCKDCYLQRFSCAHASHAACRRLVRPSPRLPHRRSAPCRCSGRSPLPARPLCAACTTELTAVVREFYDHNGIFRGQFTMTPRALVLVGDAEVDVRYHHTGQYDGVDWRRFLLAPSAGLSPVNEPVRMQTAAGHTLSSAPQSATRRWRVANMGEYHSGCYALHVRENAVDAEGRPAGSIELAEIDDDLDDEVPPMLLNFPMPQRWVLHRGVVATSALRPPLPPV